MSGSPSRDPVDSIATGPAAGRLLAPAKGVPRPMLPILGEKQHQECENSE